MARSKNKADIWDDNNLAEKPAKASAAVGFSEKKIKAIRGYTKLSLWSFPVTAIMLVVVFSGMGNAPDVKPTVITNQVDSAGKSAAIVEVNTWLDAVPAPIVGGSVVAWNGFDTEKPVKVPDELDRIVTTPSYKIEVHHFTLVDSKGSRYTSDVAVAVDKASGTTPIGSPSLSPIAPSADGWASDGPWYGLKTETASDPVTVAINQWAKAFTSGDPKVLRSIVGDPTASHSYMPLVGVSKVEATFVRGGSVPVLNKDGSPSDAKPQVLIAQVQLQLTWGTDPNAPAADGAPGGVQPQGSSLITYDLLIQKANTAAPVVVAWGGAGSGPHLKPYSQAVVDRTLTTEETN